MTIAPRRPRLTPAQVDLLRGRSRRQTGLSGVLMWEGGPSDHLLLIERGLVKITSSSRDGAPTLLALRGADELVGDFGCIDNAPRSGTVVAVGPVTAWKLSAERFQRLLHTDIDLCNMALSLTVARVRESDQRLGAFREITGPGRVIRLLADLAASLAVGADDLCAHVPVTHEELGAGAGVSRASVTRALRGLAGVGIIRQRRGSIDVTDLPALVKRAE
ncbi:Crp/Fnr family transcriptional regulator [Streptomyces cyaneofuscatus]|uniref:Crp/Fnr family transcriptional regulator n=1 Tax=Streptomyces cyaneofuscatus TaxID=66883 RepID=UPI0033A0B751